MLETTWTELCAAADGALYRQRSCESVVFGRCCLSTLVTERQSISESLVSFVMAAVAQVKQLSGCTWPCGAR